MDHFHYKDGRLHAEDVPLDTIADAVGTPFYCYSSATLTRHMTVFQDAFSGADLLVAYSVKANSNVSVLATLAQAGAGADVVSAGELTRALKAGISPEKIVFSGVGKTKDELAYAVSIGIHQINVESEPELEALSEVASELGAIAPVAMRVNPDVAAGGHEKISTGTSEHKFGIAWQDAARIYARAQALPGINPVGVDMHIGSQIADIAPFEAAAARAVDLVHALRAQGCQICQLDLGGGLGIPYHDGGQTPPEPAVYAKALRKLTDPLGVQLIFEPGRLIAGNAGVLASEVIYVKDAGHKKFLILDAGMNDLLRPALYSAKHALAPFDEPDSGAARDVYDIVGPVCETGDTFEKAREIAPLVAGDRVVFKSAGAYGAVQASQYNSRPLAPEVLVRGAQWAVVRARPSVEDMLNAETQAPWL